MVLKTPNWDAGVLEIPPRLKGELLASGYTLLTAGLRQ